jgi:antitoxin component HigA of HigAB toxin-antitoxin module
VLLSSLYESRFGFLRRDLVEWAKGKFETPVTHIPVRVDDDAVRWDLTHTLVVGTQTINSPDLLERLRTRAADSPHRYTIICPPRAATQAEEYRHTIICPRSGTLSREQVCARLAATLAEMYRNEVDATGQPMSPDPFSAIENAIEHYRVDDILISTLAGSRSKWVEEGLIDRVREITDKPVEHYEAGGDPTAEKSGETTGAVA